MLILGSCFIFAALALTLYNNKDSARAGEDASELSAQLSEMLANSAQSAESSGTDDPALSQLAIKDSEDIAAMQIGDYSVCGIINIPSIGVELAVIDNWSYKNLRISANRYYGSPDKQIMIMAHNYPSHFGKLNQLMPGDEVQFTDTNGVVYHYTVSATELLATEQLPEIIAGQDWDLTLFTCTYGGANRVVVRCVLEK